MSLGEPIENLSDLSEPGTVLLNYDHIDAIKLGIEALKAIDDYRQGLTVDFLLPLPGETE